MTPEDMKIDIVYLWVDDSDKKWRAQKDKWLEIIKGEKPVYTDAAIEARWRDNGEFLYSLRSVDKYAPWVNHLRRRGNGTINDITNRPAHGEKWLKIARVMQRIFRPIYAWDKPGMLGIKRIVKIPERFQKLGV